MRERGEGGREGGREGERVREGEGGSVIESRKLREGVREEG